MFVVHAKDWSDPEFQSLSPLPPSGQSLWLYLRCGPFRSSIPGLNLGLGVGALAERLHWSRADVMRCWNELAWRRLACADWTAGLIFLPRVIEQHPPANPNIVQGWGRVVLPECELASLALLAIRRHLEQTRSVSFVQTFDRVFRGRLRTITVPAIFPDTCYPVFDEASAPRALQVLDTVHGPLLVTFDKPLGERFPERFRERFRE